MNIEINIPDIGPNEMEVTEILVSIGDKVNIEQSLITIEGDKVSMDVPSPLSGFVQEINIKVGDKVNTGSKIMVFSVEEKSRINQNIVNESETLNQSLSNSNDEYCNNNTYIHATPVIRRLARELGVNLIKIKGTGRKGRILREDIQTYIKGLVKHSKASKDSVDNNFKLELVPWPKVDFKKFGETEEVELSKIHKASGANLSRNWVMVPHVTQFDEADITEMEEFRRQQNVEAENKKLDIKITLLVFIIKVVSKALEELPHFNSSLSEDNQKLIIKKYINIGIAIDTQNGLVVPVLRDVSKKNIIELSRELAELSKKSRSGKLTLLDMQGGCFTISSLGGIGGTAFTPIVNAPEVAILGLSKSSTKPVWNGKEFLPRLILPLSLSYDHRVIDGAAGARFISFIKNTISDIRRLVM